MTEEDVARADALKPLPFSWHALKYDPRVVNLHAFLFRKTT